MGTMSIDDGATSDTACKRKCFNCGVQGHQIADCPWEGEQTNSGKIAFREYLIEIEERRHQYSTKKPKQKRGKMNNYNKLRQWLRKNYHDGEIFDPISTITHGHSRKYDVLKNMHHSYREMFYVIMERTRERFNDLNGIATQTKKSEHNEIWQEPLNQAVKIGKPADFSQAQSNRVYADNKLIPRTRYLHYLMMDKQPICDKLRETLLPVEMDRVKCDEDNEVNVCSIGGGPGYDHMAVVLVVWYLYEMQRLRNHVSLRTIRPKHVKTDIFDLFHDEWRPIVSDLDKCFKQNIGHCLDDRDKSWWLNNEVKIHFGDVRNKLETTEMTANDDGHVLLSLRSVDLIVFQFVLHENSYFLLDKTGNICGLVDSALKYAKKGALMLCTDSTNTLWPALEKTAALYGWRYNSSGSEEHKIAFGPKSFVVLERLTISYGS
mmetsp:Transcript_681/g.936  ORF Transcript_681/g.936 Transcript_681/m.936 type:complete len:434 (-) Transcript_681:79-1380(-)